MAVTKKEFIKKAFLQITNVTSGAVQFADKWICDQGWFEILTNLFPPLKDSIAINRTNVINALNRIASPFDVTIEDVLVYHTSFTIDCPFGTSSRRPVYFFYRCTNGNPPTNPQAAPACADATRTRTVSLHSELLLSPFEEVNSAINVQSSARQDSITPRKKQADTSTASAAAVTPARDEHKQTDTHVDESQTNSTTRSVYWDSPEAAKLFGCRHDIDDVYETVSECVKLPISAIQSAHGYKRVVDGGGNTYRRQMYSPFVIDVYSCKEFISYPSRSLGRKQ